MTPAMLGLEVSHGNYSRNLRAWCPVPLALRGLCLRAVDGVSMAVSVVALS